MYIYMYICLLYICVYNIYQYPRMYINAYAVYPEIYIDIVCMTASSHKPSYRPLSIFFYRFVSFGVDRGIHYKRDSTWPCKS